MVRCLHQTLKVHAFLIKKPNKFKKFKPEHANTRIFTFKNIQTFWLIKVVKDI